MNIYDIFGYLIPGLLAVFAIQYGFYQLLNIASKFEEYNQLIVGALYLVTAFYLGIVLHELSQILEDKIYKPIWGGFLSERFLLLDDKKYTAEMKEKIKDVSNKTFGLSYQEYTEKECQETFNLIYSTVQSNKLDSQAQLFNAQYGMVRNFIAGTAIMEITVVTVFFHKWIKQGFNTTWPQLIICLLLGMVIYLLSRRLKRFGERFADYIVRAFISLKSEQGNSN